MDYLQYIYCNGTIVINEKVLNLIINGLPSIHKDIIETTGLYTVWF